MVHPYLLCLKNWLESSFTMRRDQSWVAKHSLYAQISVHSTITVAIILSLSSCMPSFQLDLDRAQTPSIYSNSLQKSLMYYWWLTTRISSDISKSCSTLSVFIIWKEALDYFFKQIFLSSVLFFSSSFTCLTQKYSMDFKGISSNSRKV